MMRSKGAGCGVFQQFNDRKIKDSKILEQNRFVYDQLNRGIENLKAEEAGLKNMIDSIWLNNETCIQIRHIVKHEMESILSNPQMLLRLALASLFESERESDENSIEPVILQVAQKISVYVHKTGDSFFVRRLPERTWFLQHRFSDH
jgi:hypothetical protein